MGRDWDWGYLLLFCRILLVFLLAGPPFMGTRPLSLSVPSLLLSGSLLLLSDALPWVLRCFGASWSESDILWRLVEGIFP